MIFNLSEIYDETSISTYAKACHALSGITLFAATILLTIIILKTPKPMKRLKFCLINYLIGAMLLHFALYLYPPMILHPNFYLYSPGISKNFCQTYQVMVLIVVILGCFMLFDSILAMTWERYFALNGTNKYSKNFYYAYRLSILSNFGIFFMMEIGIQINPIRNLLLVPPDEIETFLEEKFIGFEKNINVKSIIIFKVADYKILPFLGFLAVFGYRIFLIALGTFLTFLKSRNMDVQTQLSPQSRKLNEIFRRVLYIQYSGYCFCAVLPTIMMFIIYLFISSPFMEANWFSYAILTVELYEIILTMLFIKPYREALFSIYYWVKKYFFKKASFVSPLKTVEITMETSIIFPKTPQLQLRIT